MKPFLLIALIFAQTLSFASEPTDIKPSPPPTQAPRTPIAWLGLQVAKPDASLTTHIPALPPGIGFVIRSIDPAGPAQAAGLQVSDLLWKLSDQLLVNEAQLAALLRLSKPGDEISLAGFRGGQPLKVTLKLGEAPVTKRPFPGDLIDASLLSSDCGGPMRVVNVAARTATFSTDDGRAVVRRDGELYKVQIHGPKEEVIFDGDLPADGGLESIPDPWRRRINALRRGLNQALDGRMLPSRQPRPRVVSPVTPNP